MPHAYLDVGEEARGERKHTIDTYFKRRVTATSHRRVWAHEYRISAKFFLRGTFLGLHGMHVYGESSTIEWRRRRWRKNVTGHEPSQEENEKEWQQFRRRAEIYDSQVSGTNKPAAAARARGGHTQLTSCNNFFLLFYCSSKRATEKIYHLKAAEPEKMKQLCYAIHFTRSAVRRNGKKL